MARKIDNVMPRQVPRKRIRELTSSDLEELERHDRDFPQISPLVSLIFIKKIILIAVVIAIYFSLKS